MERSGVIPPRWATELAARVFMERRVPKVALLWRQTSHVNSSGWACLNGRKWESIQVSAGTSRMDQKLVLLHELAHVVSKEFRHSGLFWHTAWGLYRRHRVPMWYARQREFKYRAGARKAYTMFLRAARARE